MPELYIITGSNGAGKSSIGYQYLPLEFRKNHEVFDGDKLFVLKQREFWNNGLKVAKEAKKNALAFVVNTFEQLVDDAISHNEDFGYEGHFTNEETWAVPRRFKAAGYHINIIFLGLKDLKLSASRVLDRVEYGGHFVDMKTIEGNFYGNLEKLNIHFSIADSLLILDTSEAEHIILANFDNHMLKTAVPFVELPEWFKTYIPALADMVKQEGSQP